MRLLFSIIKSRVSSPLRCQEVLVNNGQISRRCVANHTSAKIRIMFVFAKRDSFYNSKCTEVCPEAHLRGDSICVFFDERDSFCKSKRREVFPWTDLRTHLEHDCITRFQNSVQAAQGASRNVFLHGTTMSVHSFPFRYCFSSSPSCSHPPSDDMPSEQEQISW